MKLRNLFVRIGFDVNDKPVKDLDAGIKGLIVSIGAISGAVVAAATSLFGLAKFTANAGEEAKKAATMLGLDVEAYQELSYAAELSEMSVSEFQMSLRLLANSASNSAMGLKADILAFNKLGVSATTSNGKLKAADTLLAEIAEKFSKMPDTLEKTALAQDLFGRSGAQLIPMLNEGAAGIERLRREARESGTIMSAESAAACDEFNDSLFRLKSVVLGVRNQIGLGLIPALTELIGDTRDWLLVNRELVKSTIQDWIKRTIVLIKSLYSFVKQAVEIIKDLADELGGLNKVIKVVSTTIGIFIGLKLVYSLGLMAKGAYGLAAAFTTMGTAAMWAQIKLFAIPMLIGGAIIGLILLLEDLWRFTRGDKSVFGVLVDAFAKKFPKAFAFVSEIFMVIHDFMSGLNNIINGVALVWAGLMNFDIKAIMAGLNEVNRVFYEAFSRIGNTIKNIFTGVFDWITGTSAYKALDGFIGRVLSWAFWQNGPSGMTQPFSSSPATAPATSYSSTVNSPSSSVSINAPVNVVVPPGTSPAEIGPRVRDAVKDAFGELLRQNYTPSTVEW